LIGTPPLLPRLPEFPRAEDCQSPDHFEALALSTPAEALRFTGLMSPGEPVNEPA